MTNLWVRKTGRVCQLFEVPFDDYDNPPDTFPQTISVDSVEQLRRMYPGHSIRVIEPKPRQEPTQIESQATSAQRAAAMADLGIPEDVRASLMAKESKAPVSPGPSTTLSTAAPLNAVGERVLQEFRLVLASIGNGYTKEEAEAIANFILAVDPGLEQELVRLKLTATGVRRFTL